MLYAFLVCCVIGAFYRRWWGSPKTCSRWAVRGVGFVLSSCIMAIAGVLEPFVLLGGAALWTFMWVPHIGSYLDMGQNQWEDKGIFAWATEYLWTEHHLNRFQYDLVSMGLRYVVFTITLGCWAAFWTGNPTAWAYCPLGALAGPAYAIPYRLGIKHYTAWAEYILGATLTGGLFLL